MSSRTTILPPPSNAPDTKGNGRYSIITERENTKQGSSYCEQGGRSIKEQLYTAATNGTLEEIGGKYSKLNTGVEFVGAIPNNIIVVSSESADIRETAVNKINRTLASYPSALEGDAEDDIVTGMLPPDAIATGILPEDYVINYKSAYHEGEKPAILTENDILAEKDQSDSSWIPALRPSEIMPCGDTVKPSELIIPEDALTELTVTENDIETMLPPPPTENDTFGSYSNLVYNEVTEAINRIIEESGKF